MAVGWAPGNGAVADAGRPIPLKTREFNLAPAELQAGDAALFTNGKFAARALRTAPPSDQYNCHGWVFTDGRFCINSQDVDTILHDNNYQPVHDPKPGDLVVYRSSGNITHTGIVPPAVPLLI